MRWADFSFNFFFQKKFPIGKRSFFPHVIWEERAIMAIMAIVAMVGTKRVFHSIFSPQRCVDKKWRSQKVEKVVQTLPEVPDGKADAQFVG